MLWWFHQGGVMVLEFFLLTEYHVLEYLLLTEYIVLEYLLLTECFVLEYPLLTEYIVLEYPLLTECFVLGISLGGNIQRTDCEDIQRNGYIMEEGMSNG